MIGERLWIQVWRVAGAKRSVPRVRPRFNRGTLRFAPATRSICDEVPSC